MSAIAQGPVTPAALPSPSPVTSVTTTLLGYLSCGAFTSHTTQDDIAAAASTDSSDLKGLHAVDDDTMLKNAEDSTEAPGGSEKQVEDAKPMEAEEKTMAEPEGEADITEKAKEDEEKADAVAGQAPMDDCTDAAKVEEKPGHGLQNVQESLMESPAAEEAHAETLAVEAKPSERLNSTEKPSDKPKAKSSKKWFLPKSKWMGGKVKDQAKATKTSEMGSEPPEKPKEQHSHEKEQGSGLSGESTKVGSKKGSGPSTEPKVVDGAADAKSAKRSYFPKWIGGKAKSQPKAISPEMEQSPRPYELTEKPTEKSAEEATAETQQPLKVGEQLTSLPEASSAASPQDQEKLAEEQIKEKDAKVSGVC